MKFFVSKEAAKWFIDEMGLEQGDYIQLFAKIYGGIPTVHPKYFLGVTVGKDEDFSYKDVVEGITFYFKSEDKWFLEDYDLKVEMGEEEAEYKFTSTK